MSMALCYQFRGVESTSAFFPHQAGLASLGSVFRNGTWPSMLASSESDRVFRGHLEPESSRPNSCSPPSNGAKPPVLLSTEPTPRSKPGPDRSEWEQTASLSEPTVIPTGISSILCPHSSTPNVVAGSPIQVADQLLPCFLQLTDGGALRPHVKTPDASMDYRVIVPTRQPGIIRKLPPFAFSHPVENLLPVLIAKHSTPRVSAPAGRTSARSARQYQR